MVKTYKIISDKPIMVLSKEEVETLLKDFLGTRETAVPGTKEAKPKDKSKDTSRSGKEWAEICKLVKKDKSKEDIFEEMMAFKKWAEGSEKYREHTYKKAVEEVEKKKDSKPKRSILAQEQVKQMQEQNFEGFCYYVRDLYSSTKKDDRTEGEGLIVKYLLDNYYFKTPEDSKEVYVYKDGIYVGNGEALIGKKVQGILDKQNSNHNTNEIIGHIQRTTYIKRDEFIEPLNLICLQNGVLNIDTMEVEPYSPNYLFLNKINAHYDKDAACHKIEKFLKEVLIKREDWDNSAADLTDLVTIQEFIGYLLYKKIIFNRAVMLYGEGENGKSTGITLIKRFLGDKNVSNIPIQKLETNNFAVASLYGKLANLHADLPKTALKETSKFKQLTGGDTLDAEKKFRDAFSFVPYAKMMFAANTLPATYDDTRAFWRRWLIFRFPNSFEENKEGTKKNILDELTSKEEISGLLNWAIEGLKRLLANQKFTINRSTGEVREEYIRKSDSIGAFILDMIQEHVGSFIIKKDLYESYAQYCRERAYDMVAENTFHQRFHQKVNVREYSPKIDGKQKQTWSGVRFKTSTQSNVDDGLDHNFEEDNEDVGLDEWVND